MRVATHNFVLAYKLELRAIYMLSEQSGQIVQVGLKMMELMVMMEPSMMRRKTTLALPS